MAATVTDLDQLVDDYLGPLTYFLRNNRALNSEHKAMLKLPHFVERLERKLHMPITGHGAYFVENYPAHHYTINWNQYHDLNAIVKLAIKDGDVDAVIALVGNNLHVIFDNIPSLQIASQRGHVKLLGYLLNLDEIDLNPDRVAVIEPLYYTAIAYQNRMDLVDADKIDIYIRNLVTGAICGNQLELLKGLRPKTYTTYDFDLAAELGHSLILAFVFSQVESQPQSDNLLRRALTSGDVKTINVVLKSTRATFRIDHLDQVMIGGNMSIATRFESQFPEQFQTYITDRASRYLQTGNLNVINFVLNHIPADQSMWLAVLRAGLVNYNMPVVRMAVTRGHLTKHDVLGIWDNIDHESVKVKIDEFIATL